MAIRHYVYAAGIAASLALFAACGDEVTEVTNVSEKASLDQVKKFKELPKCDEDAEGSLVYVKDSAKVFSCSGKDWVQLNGKDGSDGKNGSNGEDGSSCTVKQNKKKTGLDIVCDGKKVGSVENGSDGKNGSDGNDGTSCTVKQNKKKTGFDIICDGKTVGTVSNGDDGKIGDGCSLEDNGLGQVTVKCGGKTVTLVKDFCGTETFDSETQFCVENKPYLKCHNVPEKYKDQLNEDGSYDVKSYFCDTTDVLENLCGGKTFDLTTQFCYLNMVVLPRCSEVAEGVEKDQLYADKSYSGFYFCHNGVLWNKCGGNRYVSRTYGSEYDPETQFCSLKDPGDPSGLIVDRCGKKKKEYDVNDSMCVNGKVVNAKECCKLNGVGENWCEEDSHIYDVRTHFCDTRDGQSYKFTKIVKETEAGKVYSETWMAENLNYVLTAAADFVSECRKKDGSCDKTYGRYYSWPTAKIACPDGWALPTQDQYADLFGAYGNDIGAFLNESMNTSGFSVIPGGLFEADPEDEDKVYTLSSDQTNYGLFWSKTGTDPYNAFIGMIDGDEATATASKAEPIVDDLYLLNVRCIKKD
jgi:uncharacterized protein (TIGR02145 family)